jgi:hypothetical protein
MRRSWCGAGLAAAIVLGAPGAAGGAQEPSKERVVTRAVHLPSTIREPEFPSYTADGSRILAAARSSEFDGQQLVSFTPTGSDLRCLTCGHWTGPEMQKMFPLPDGRRILVRIGVQSALSAAGHGIVECSPSVLDCRDATVLPIKAPSEDDPNVVQTQREFRIAPDGRHVALTQIRSTNGGLIDGIGIVGRLERRPDGYRVEDARVVAERGEIKGFTPDGRGVLVARFNAPFEAGNPDDLRVDLRTGRETRVTHHPDWEEDLDVAAQRYRGQRWMVVGSARGTGLLETVSQLRRPAAIEPAISGLPFRVYALRNPEIAEPWLVSLSAEARGQLGQPLAPGAIAAGWNSRPNFLWKPDGTGIVYWQRRIENEDVTRVVISGLPDRQPRAAAKVRPTPTPHWAPPLAGYVPRESAAPTSRRGKVSGRLRVQLAAAPPDAGYQRFIRVRYVDFADRRGYVLNGVESGYYDPPGLFGANSVYSADLVLSGKHRGYLRANDVAIEAGRIRGSIESRVDGRRLNLGPLP